MGEQEAGVSELQEISFEELFRQERLPSGHEYELMPDTVENALSVAEASDARPWKHKVMQAFAVTKSIGSISVQEQGWDYMQNILDTDLVFIGLAWSAQLNGMEFDLSEPVPCPACGHAFKKIGFSNLKIHVRPTPMQGPGVWPVEDLDKDLLPDSLKKGQIMVSDTTWLAARKNIGEAQWENQDVVNIHRAMASLRVSTSGNAPRAVIMAEARKMSAKSLVAITREMNRHIPYFEQSLDLECKKCKSVSTVPFSQGLG